MSDPLETLIREIRATLDMISSGEATASTHALAFLQGSLTGVHAAQAVISGQGANMPSDEHAHALLRLIDADGR